jgi:hypothetical protein
LFFSLSLGSLFVSFSAGLDVRQKPTFHFLVVSDGQRQMHV